MRSLLPPRRRGARARYVAMPTRWLFSPEPSEFGWGGAAGAGWTRQARPRRCAEHRREPEAPPPRENSSAAPRFVALRSEWGDVDGLRRKGERAPTGRATTGRTPACSLDRRRKPSARRALACVNHRLAFPGCFSRAASRTRNAAPSTTASPSLLDRTMTSAMKPTRAGMARENLLITRPA